MKTMFYHGVTTDNRRFTIAGTLSNDFVTLKLGVAICGAKELFEKRVGRIKAESRLLGSAKRGVVSTLSIDDKVNYYKEFVESCSAFNKLNSKDLKRVFNLYHDADKS